MIINDLYGEFMKIWRQQFEEIAPANNLYDGDISMLDLDFMQDLQWFSNSIKIIFDRQRFKLLRVWGAEKMSDLKVNSTIELLTQFFQHLSKQHAFFPIDAIRWVFKIRKLHVGLATRFTLIYCGVQINIQNGESIRLLIRYEPLKLTDKKVEKFAVITVYDITHLVKEDFYWGRCQFFDEEHSIFHIISNDNKTQRQDILSDREKEVLKLYAHGYTLKEVADKLHISTHTVNNHRKNMLLRTGVRDITSLIQICRMTGII